MSSTEDVIVSQPAGTRTLALRESYLAICEDNACEAHLLNANERWYAYKLKNRRQSRHVNKTAESGGEAPEADESLWVFMSAAEWASELLGMYNEKTIRQKLDKLVERGFLVTRSNPKRKWDRKPQWMFMRANVQAAVDAWAADRTPPELDPTSSDEQVVTPKDAHQDDSDIATESSRTNVRVESDKVPNGVGQSSASIRTNVRSNTTGIIHRDLPQPAKTEVVDPLTENAREGQPGHDDFGTPAEPKSAAQFDDVAEPAQKPMALEADFDLDPENPDDFAGLFDNEPGEQAKSEITSSEEVPGGGEKIHKLQKWDPAATNAEIDRFCNGAWLRGRGTSAAWVTEVDASGVDRHTIAEVLSPAFVAEVAARIRQERTAKLSQAGRGEGVPSFQHLLIQELQLLALRAEQVRGLIEAATQDAESPEEGPRDDDPAQAPAPAPLTLRALGQGRQWRVGDVVSYRRDRYQIVDMDERKIYLDSDECGSVDIIRATDEVKALRLVSSAEANQGASA